MVWKILASLAAVFLGAAAYFANASKTDILNEKGRLDRSAENLKEAQASNKKGAEVLDSKKKIALQVSQDLEKAKTDVSGAESDVKQKEAELELAKKNLDQISQQLAAVEKKIEEAGDIEKLLAQVAALKKDKEAAELEVTNQTQALAAIAEKIATVDTETKRYREIDARQRSGVMEADFQARIAQYFGEWGFAVLNKGNAGGVVANAELDVKRGQDVVAKLKVRNVENAICVADLVPGSLIEGEALRSGDLVVPAPKPVKAEPPPTSAPAKAGAQPAPGAAPAAPAPGADPFGGGMAPAPAPAAGADPFGGAPAPAPAPAAADPFGGAPAAPAPAPGAAMDPFGGTPAPAPAPGGAPAGTKENPSTADPFK
ncbi:MAG: hypothetical protein JNJ83_16305 [Verrucomicrobiaceae bacterium]|nr:hypothetical protein [Verrucomicrobiaceae bacterium]